MSVAPASSRAALGGAALVALVCSVIGLAAEGLWLIAPSGVVAAAGFAAWWVWDISTAALVVVLAVCLVATPVLNWPLRPITYLWMVVVLGAVVAYLTRRTGRLADVPLPTAILFAPPLIAAAAHWSGISSLRFAAQPLIALVGLVGLVGFFARTRPERLRQIGIALLWLSVGLAALAVYQRATGTWPFTDAHVERPGTGASGFAGRSAAIFGHPIPYGVFAQTMLLLALAWRVRFWEVVVAANLGALLLSGSRTSLLVVVVLAPLVVLLQARSAIPRPRTAQPRTLLLAVGLVVALFASPGIGTNLRANLEDRLSGGTAQASNTIRTTRLRIGWNAARRDLGTTIFGHGPHAAAYYWRDAEPLNDGGRNTFDNAWLTFLYDYGLLGVAVIAGGALLALAHINWGGRIILAGLLANAWLFDVLVWPPMFALLALAVGVGRLDPPAERVLRRPDRAARRAGLPAPASPAVPG